MNKMRGAFAAVLGILGLAFQADAIPTVTINDLSGPITVTASSGISGFAYGNIGGSSEAVWWCGTIANLSYSLNSGLWTEPGSSKVSDEFVVGTFMGKAFGVFFSDPAKLPTTFQIPGTSITIPLFGGSTSAETGGPTQISGNPAVLSVIATSGVPDGGSTIMLLGLGFIGVVSVAGRISRSLKKA